MTADPSNQDNVRVQELEARSELRVELVEASLRAAAGDATADVGGGACYFKLITGTAELFGTELAQVG